MTTASTSLHLQHPAVVVVPRGLAAGLLRGKIHIRLVDVTDRDDLGVLVRDKRVEHLIATISQADEPEAHAVVAPRTRVAPAAVANKADAVVVPN